MFGANGLSGAPRSGEINARFSSARRSVFDGFLARKMGLEFGNFTKSLMCVLVSGRNFSVLCFL
jgi:hypothetical protein